MAGYRVITIGPRSRRSSCVGGFHVDLLFADWGRPDINGREPVSKVREACPPASLPILKITGWSAKDTGPMDVGAWLPKPIDRDQLLSMVRSLLGAEP